MNKILKDIETADFKRKQSANHLNKELRKYDLQFVPLHAALPFLTDQERKTRNTYDNRNADGKQPIGFTYQLVNMKTKRKIPFIFIYKSTNALYLKLPSEHTPETYLNALERDNFHLLVLDDMKFTYISLPISISLLKTWKYTTGGLGNKNRVQFHVKNVTKIECLDLHKRNIFGDSRLDALLNLFEKIMK